MTLSGLVILVLFIHPYLMAMVAAVAAAVPVTLAARVLIAGSVRERHAWRRPAQAAAIVSVGLAATMLLARGLGYFQQDTDADYGRYSMNLAAPFWPVLSRVAPATTGSLMDATGGQFEGYQYLGAGLIGLLAALLVSTRGRTWLLAACRRHAGLLLATAGLSAYAVSTHVWLLHWSLLDWRVVPPGGAALRASGRLFWPVAYVLLLAGVRGVNLAWPRAAAIVLLAAAALQVFDSSALRATARSRKYLADLPPDTVQMRLDGIVAHYNTVTLEPRLECDADDIPDAMRVIYMAARLDLPVNTMYVARHEPGNNCALPDGDENLTLLSPGSLGVAYGTRRAKQAAIWRQYGMRCGVLANYVLCSTNGSGLVGLAAPADPVVTPIPMAVTLTAAAQGLFTDKLAAGWYGVEKWGVWAATPHPELWIPVPHDNRSLRVTLGLHAPPGVNSRTVSVHAGGITGPVVGEWSVSQQDRTYSFVLPPGSNQLGDTGMIVLLIDCHTVVSIPSDPRRFGIGLTSIRVDPVGPP